MGSAHAGRRSVGFWSIGCVLALVVVAASGFLGSGPAVAVRSAGHWVYNETLGAVVHVNGAAKNADAQAPVPGANPANQVAQDDKHGYVIGRRNGKLIVFGKSSLQVESTLPLGTTEDPVVVESLGATYLVFPSGGRIVRLGTKLAVITSGGGALASPVAVSDGTVWVRRGGSGGERLCRVQRGSDTMSCPVRVPSGHRGTLTVVDDRPAFVDQTVATIALVSPSGLGQSVPMGASVQAVSDGQVAGADAGGRLAVVTQAGSGRSASLVLVDASTVGSRGQAAPPITVSLGSDLFDPPMTAGGAVVLVDRTANKVITYDNHGVRKASVAGPHGGVMHASRGQDGRVYVDGSGGKTTLVVDGDGTVTPVTNDNGQGKGKPGAPGTTPPAATNGPGTTPTEPPVSGGTPAVPLPSPP
ncbi:MAG: fibronectin type III domain-containing protein, partial [Pseudonocardiales bacterium]